MKRRTFIGTAVVASLAGCSGGNSEPVEEVPRTPETVPTEISVRKETLKEYHSKVESLVDNPKVFVNKDGEVVLEYDSTVKSKDELETEVYSLIEIYVDLIEEDEASTFTVVIDKVQYVAPSPPVKAYVRGDLELDALFETIEVMSVERN